MNINVIRLGPLTKAVNDLNKTVARLADAYEMALAQEGLHVRPPTVDTSGPDPEAIYVDEEVDALREILEQRGAMTPSLRRLFGEDESVPPENN